MSPRGKKCAKGNKGICQLMAEIANNEKLMNELDRKHNLSAYIIPCRPKAVPEVQSREQSNKNNKARVLPRIRLNAAANRKGKRNWKRKGTKKGPNLKRKVTKKGLNLKRKVMKKEPNLKRKVTKKESNLKRKVTKNESIPKRCRAKKPIAVEAAKCSSNHILNCDKMPAQQVKNLLSTLKNERENAVSGKLTASKTDKKNVRKTQKEKKKPEQKVQADAIITNVENVVEPEKSEPVEAANALVSSGDTKI